MKTLNFIFIIFIFKSICYSQKSDDFNYLSVDKINLVIKEANSYLKVPYLYGGCTRKGIDCSCLVCNCFKKANLNIPRNSKAQSNWHGLLVKKMNMIQAGDLVFFSSDKKKTVNHVGIVIDNSQGLIKFIHASNNKKKVTYDYLSSKPWNKYYINTKKIFVTKIL